MEKRLEPPKQIWYSLYAFLCTIPVVIVDFLITIFKYKGNLRILDVNAYMLDLAITALFMLLIFRRKNWARFIYATFTFLIVLSVFWMIKDILSKNIYNFISLSVQVSLRLLSVGFLFVKQSNEWFKHSHVEYSNTKLGNNESIHDSNSFPNDYNQSITSPSCAGLASSTSETTQSLRLRNRLKENKRIQLTAGFIFSILILIVIIYIGHRAMRASAIRNAMAADIALSRQLFGNRSMMDSNEKTLRAYTQGLREIDMSRCPRDFQLAYLDHIQAWESLTRSRASEDILSPLIEFFLLNKIPDIPDNLDEKPINEEIFRTWYQVERIALKYDVRVPK